MNWKYWFALGLLLGLLACDDLVIEQPASPPPAFPVPKDKELEEPTWPEDLDKDQYRDKILGLLVGSAIGDAMGAPTEMWHRDQIKMQRGYVDDLQAVIREGSPEGPWAYNMPGGGTTDDTRWKYLLTKYLSRTGTRTDSLDVRAFAQYIIDIYLAEKDQVSQVTDFDPARLETEIRHMAWLQEWAKVAQPYLQDDMDGYNLALHKFYGGEMACAGMLYAPMIGGYFPGAPHRAYKQAYRLGLFDIGYARDITGLTAAYVAQALKPGTKITDITELTAQVDPYKYFQSRLVGRIAHQIYLEAKRIAYQSSQMDTLDSQISDSLSIPDPKVIYEQQVAKAYTLLDEKLQDIPFHANEIHLINLTAILFTDGDFKKAIEFVVNYGRDNDTVAAVTGAILGAYWGYQDLPSGWAAQVVNTSREVVGIDLEQLADELVSTAYPE